MKCKYRKSCGHDYCNLEDCPEFKKATKKMNYSKIDNVVLDGIDTNDYPDFCNAFIFSADYNGKPMTEDQLNEINEDHDYVYQEVINHLY